MPLAGYDFVVTGADYSANAAAFDMPAAESCLFWAFFGGSVSRSIRNLSAGQKDGSVFGKFDAGDIQAGYLKMKAGARGIRTADVDTAEGTVLVVARNTDTLADNSTKPCLFSSGGSGTAGGNRVIMETSTSLNLSIGTSLVGGGGSGLTVDSVNSWKMYAATYGEIVAGTDNMLYDLTGGVSAGNNHASGAVRVLGTIPLQFGSNISGSTLAGTADIAFGAHFNRKLTTTELAACRSKVGAVLSGFGISI
jgi:hypothetical protein